MHLTSLFINLLTNKYVKNKLKPLVFLITYDSVIYIKNGEYIVPPEVTKSSKSSLVVLFLYFFIEKEFPISPSHYDQFFKAFEDRKKTNIIMGRYKVVLKFS